MVAFEENVAPDTVSSLSAFPVFTAWAKTVSIAGLVKSESSLETSFAAVILPLENVVSIVINPLNPCSHKSL